MFRVLLRTGTKKDAVADFRGITCNGESMPRRGRYPKEGDYCKILCVLIAGDLVLFALI